MLHYSIYTEKGKHIYSPHYAYFFSHLSCFFMKLYSPKPYIIIIRIFPHFYHLKTFKHQIYPYPYSYRSGLCSFTLLLGLGKRVFEIMKNILEIVSYYTKCFLIWYLVDEYHMNFILFLFLRYT